MLQAGEFGGFPQQFILFVSALIVHRFRNVLIGGVVEKAALVGDEEAHEEVDAFRFFVDLGFQVDDFSCCFVRRVYRLNGKTGGLRYGRGFLPRSMHGEQNHGIVGRYLVRFAHGLLCAGRGIFVLRVCWAQNGASSKQDHRQR